MTLPSRTLREPDEGTELLPGGWLRLRGRGTTPWEAYLRDPRGTVDEATRAEAWALPSSSEIRIEWDGDVVRWGIASDGSDTPRRATAGLVHEPCDDLYASLPLARYDRRARRFWNTVLWIARWPGGSGLIERLAGRRRTTDSA